MTIQQAVDETSTTKPRLETIGGVSFYVFPDGYRLPRIGGAEDDPPADPETPPAAPTADDEADWDKPRAKATIDKLRKTENDLKKQIKELQGYKKQVDDLAAKDQSATEKAASDVQAATAALEETQKQLRAERTERAVERAASKLNFIDPDDALSLLKGIEYDDDGKPTNIDELLAALAKAKPHLIKASGEGEPAKAGGKPPAPGPKPDGKKPEPSQEEKDRAQKQQAQVYRSAW